MKPAKAPLPTWLQPLLTSTFFEQCEVHVNNRKNEVNLFCMDCACSLCSNCVIKHTNNGGTHNLLQIRHYVHSDVVRVNDVIKLLDITNIQPYVANGAKVIHLNPKNSKPCPFGVPRSYSEGTPCIVCSRSISKASLFCSIACKITEYADNEEISSIEANEDASDGSNKSLTGVKRTSTEQEASSSTSSTDPPAENSNATPPPKSYRKKSRKGIPVRAPFF